MKLLKANRRLAIILGLSAILLIVLVAKGLLITSLLFFLGAISHAYRRWVKGWPVGNELATLGTIVVALIHGPVAGAFFGFVTVLVMQFIAFDLDFGMVLQLFATTLTGLLVPFIPLPPIALIFIFQTFAATTAQLPGLIGDFETRVQSVFVIATKVVFAVVMWNALYKYLYALA